MNDLYSVEQAIKLAEGSYVQARTALDVYLKECQFMNRYPKIDKLTELSSALNFAVEQRIELEELRRDLSDNLVSV